MMIEKMAPSDVWSAMEIPEFRKAIDEELKTINEFHTYCCDSDKNPNSWTSFDVSTVRKVSGNLAEI